MSGVRICVHPESAELTAGVERIASLTNRPVRPLQLQALLQLPRLADKSGFAPRSETENLLYELAAELPASKEWSVADFVDCSPRSLRFRELAFEEGQDLMKRFHYLRSPRIDGRLYGLTAREDRIVALCVSSPVDVPALKNLLPPDNGRLDFARVLSRVFVFDGSPRNTISYLLARTRRAERKFGITHWITYVNPNIGFTGVSYLASGWQLLGEEPDTTYRYVDERYITDRELIAKFGLHDDVMYASLLGNRFAKSKMRLSSLMLFGDIR